MNWFMSLFRGGILKKGLQKQAPNKNRLGRRTIMSLLALAGGAIAYGAVRRRNGGGKLIQQITKPFRKRLVR